MSEGTVEFTADGVDTPVKTWYKVFGDLKSRRPLVTLHGGPGVVHNYMLALADLVQTHGIPVVVYDQLGNGNSTHLPEKMGDTSFWTEALFIKQLTHLLEHLGIQNDFDLLGHSWGGMLSARFATQQPKGLKNLIISDSPASMKLWVEAANKLRSQLPSDVQVCSRSDLTRKLVSARPTLPERIGLARSSRHDGVRRVPRGGHAVLCSPLVQIGPDPPRYQRCLRMAAEGSYRLSHHVRSAHQTGTA